MSPSPNESRRTIDTATLSRDEASAIERLVRAANFFTLSPTLSEPPRGAADLRIYELDLEHPTDDFTQGPAMSTRGCPAAKRW